MTQREIGEMCADVIHHVELEVQDGRIPISDLEGLEDRLRLLSTAGERLAASVEYSVVLEEAARIAVSALCDLCIIDVASASGAVERKVVLFADPRKQAAVAARLIQFTSRPGRQTPQAQVIASGEPMLLAEVSAHLRERISDDERDADAMRAADIRSLMVVPLAARGRTFGALTLASAASDRRYASDDLQFARDLASRIAMALDNARLYDDLQRANAALRLSHAKSSGILSIAADAIVSVDSDQRIALFNDGAVRIFGYSKEEAIGAPLDILIPERFRAIHRQHLQRFASGEQSSRRMGERSAAFRGLRKNGEEFPADVAISRLDVGGETILTAALRDVTDEKRSERDQKLLADLGLVLAGTLDYEETLTKIAQLAVRDLADFCFVDLVEDDGEVRRLRVVAREPSSEWICDFLTHTPIDRSGPQLLWSPLETRQPILIESVTPEMLASWAQSDEHLRVLRAMDPKSIMVAPLVARRVLGVLKVVSTTSPRAYGENDLRLLTEVACRAALAIDNAKLYRGAERAIHVRDEVLGVVAHDLRNPLSNIVMALGLLERERECRSQKPVQLIRRSVARMNRLIQDLLDVVRMETGHLSLEQAAVDAGELLSEFVEAQRPLASSMSLELRLDVEEDLGEVSADRDRLLQVLENLVGNAEKFTRPGGCLTVGAAPREGELLFWLKDTGAGIASADLPHIFDRFWQARKAGRKGAGLGLSIVKGIVEAHGGRIWIESEVGAGSTFFFTMPLTGS